MDKGKRKERWMQDKEFRIIKAGYGKQNKESREKKAVVSHITGPQHLNSPRIENPTMATRPGLQPQNHHTNK